MEQIQIFVIQKNISTNYLFSFKTQKFLQIRTPLHVASKNGMLEFVVALVMNGKAEVNPVDINKKTPLKYVSEKLKKGKRFEEVYKFLESQGGVEDWRV